MVAYAGKREGSGQEPLKQVTENYDRAYQWLEPYHARFAENYTFHYYRQHYDDINANERDRRRAKPRGRQTSSKHRHKLAQVMKAALYISADPVDDAGDADSAERVRWFMEYEVRDPSKRFKRVLRRAVSLAMATDAGAIGLKVYHDMGPNPVIRPYLIDPRSVLWTPGWQDPDDDTCPWVITEEWLSPSECERMSDKRLGKWAWKQTKDLQGSTSAGNTNMGTNDSRSRSLGEMATGNAGPGYDSSKDGVRVLFCWYRHDHSTAYRDTDEFRDLQPNQRYLACPTCGLTDYSMDGDMLPEMGGPCPECQSLGAMSALQRVDRERVTEEVRAYREGKRLVIVAPDEQRTFFDGPWPETVGGRPIRNIPLAFIKCYDIPLDPWGSSDTEWDYTYQVIANALERRLYEFLSQTGGIIITSWDGLWSADGQKPFTFSDRPVSLARTKNMGVPQVQFFEPRGAVGEALPYMNFLNGQFRADMGISDLGLTPQSSKDIPVRTTQMLLQTGEISADDMAEQVREALSPLIGTWYDLKRGIMTERQLVRLRGPDGVPAWQAMRGEEMPDSDVVVGSGPVWDEFDAERGQQFQQLFQVPPALAGMPQTWPAYWSLLGEVANIPQEMIAKATRILMPPAQGAPAPGGIPAPPMMGGQGAPSAMPQPIANRMAGAMPMNGNGGY